MYRIVTSITGDTLMTCSECGHVVGIAAMCKTPLEATVQMLAACLGSLSTYRATV
jgi:hypothetical protein